MRRGLKFKAAPRTSRATQLAVVLVCEKSGRESVTEGLGRQGKAQMGEPRQAPASYVWTDEVGTTVRTKRYLCTSYQPAGVRPHASHKPLAATKDKSGTAGCSGHLVQPLQAEPMARYIDSLTSASRVSHVAVRQTVERVRVV